ncbi:flagellar hook-length control protein FliK [Cellvibrio sp. UBA7671]|uniref:flagellar hook-length control protein FliK n=1 Tax=Cellvibrio sp. UBA7671 TaxID=1946312 RepID=UPI002F35A91C
MELSSITDKLVQNVQRAQIEQIMSITKVLGLKVGSQFLADVQKVTQATPEERAQLVKSIEANLAQLNKNSAAPAIKALIRELETHKNIAQTPGVKLVTLTVNTLATVIPSVPATTTPPAPVAATLLTYTNQPLQIGQTLLMQLSEGQRLQLLQPLTKAEIATFNALLQIGNLPTTTTPNTTQANTNPVNTNNLNHSQLATSTLLNDGVITKENVSAVLEQNKLAATKTTEVIGETLRRLLPQKDKGQDLLASLPKITQFIQQLPLAERKEWLSSQVQQSLKTLANHIRLSDQLTNPKLVEMTLKNNGQSFEHKLAQFVTGKQSSEAVSTFSTGALLAQKNSPPTSTTPVNPASTVNSALLTTHMSPGANNKTTISAQNPVEKIATQDLKGALLGLLHQLDTELETTKPTLPGSPLATEINKNVLAIALPQFLGMLTHKQQGELSQKQLRTQLVMLMHQYTLGSIAKIQLQQVHTLNHQLGQADQAQPTQSWQFEIPVRQGQDVHPLHIQIEQQWVEEQNENAEKNSARVRQWNVMLSFDLPLIGQFYAQLTLLGDNLSAKFWAENENTLQEAKNKIDGLKTQLEREGIQVAQMQCVPGLPPKPKMSFSYSLVDVKT